MPRSVRRVALVGLAFLVVVMPRPAVAQEAGCPAAIGDLALVGELTTNEQGVAGVARRYEPATDPAIRPALPQARWARPGADPATSPRAPSAS